MKNQILKIDYSTELIKYPGQWSFQLPHSGIIFVNDQELLDMSENPDKILNLSTGFEPREQSLRQVCVNAKEKGAPTLKIAFDHFFAQYRPGTDVPRSLTPDMDEYVERIARIGKFAENYGLRLELSLLSPLEIGHAYEKATGESGRWMQYRKGLRDPETGAFSVQFWQHRHWTNNKGHIDLESEKVRVFAFKEEKILKTSYRVVRPESIIEITEAAETEVFEGICNRNVACRARVFGKGMTNIGDLDKVIIVQQYKCPEMDYFSDSALPYLKTLINKYVNAGVKLSGFYSDEMHIQQDWDYFSHHEHGQFALRYVSPGFEKKFAEKFGDQYNDFAKYLLYFVYGQEDSSIDLSANEGVMHVFGSSPEEIHQTALFRSRYYSLLQDGVVDLFTAAKRHAEEKIGNQLFTRAHATWAESPTIDFWRAGNKNENSQKYEYTSNFVWSCTVHQAAAACHDYFKWGEYLTGNGTDHPECGWLDRNYYGLALACSLGIINEIPYAYCAHWGHPKEISNRRLQLQNTFGAGTNINIFSMVQNMQHRDVEVLMLYPLNLVSVEERFGSWMTQYGYANMITQSKLIELGKINDGKIELGGRLFHTLVITFEPFPEKGLLDKIKEFADGGGRVIWAGPPPLINENGSAVSENWQELFGVSYMPSSDGWGEIAPGHQITFENIFENVSPQTILTDFIVDHVYPVIPNRDTVTVAKCNNQIIGTRKVVNNNGSLTFLGYRPRDDQSASLGYETRNLFDILYYSGAYLSVSNDGTNDNTEVISRTTKYLACRFPNGAVAVAPHLARLEENWAGGFSRNYEEDEKKLKQLELPDKLTALKLFKVNGHCVDYEGTGAVSFRVDESGNLIAFAGQNCSNITIDDREFIFADKAVGAIGWAPVAENRKVDNGAILIVYCDTAGSIRIPAKSFPESIAFYAERNAPGKKGEPVFSKNEGDYVTVEISEAAAGRWIFGVEEK